MFLIRVAFWLGLVVLLLPTDERQQARLYGTAAATVERVATFCDRNAQACVAAGEAWSTFLKKAEFGARAAVDLATSSGRREREEEAERAQPASLRRKAEPGREARLEPRAEAKQPAPARGTLTPADLSPPWRGQSQRDPLRTGT